MIQLWINLDELDVILDALGNYSEATSNALEYDREIMPIGHRLSLLSRLIIIKDIENKLKERG